MKNMTYRDAIKEALDEELSRDEHVILLGEDIADPFGGSFKVTLGLSTKFGCERVRNTPISENAIAGTALGAAMTGMRPVAEIMYVDFCGCAMDQIMNQIAKIRYMSGGQIAVPLVLRVTQGTGRSSAAQHSQNLEAIFAHIPGLMVAMPATPRQAKGLLKSAIRGNDPTIFIEQKMLYNSRGDVPDGEYLIPFGQAEILREGQDVTIVATGAAVRMAMDAAERLDKMGIGAEVIDPVTIVPLDETRILDSVKKTGRLVIAHEANRRCGWGAELSSMVSEQVFSYLRSPVAIVASENTPVPFSPPLEKFVTPDANDIVQAAQGLMKGDRS